MTVYRTPAKKEEEKTVKEEAATDTKPLGDPRPWFTVAILAIEMAIYYGFDFSRNSLVYLVLIDVAVVGLVVGGFLASEHSDALDKEKAREKKFLGYSVKTLHRLTGWTDEKLARALLETNETELSRKEAEAIVSFLKRF